MWRIPGRYSPGGDPDGSVTRQQLWISVVPNYVTRHLSYGALVESFCSEQNSRMMAMQSASDNAAELLK